MGKGEFVLSQDWKALFEPCSGTAKVERVLYFFCYREFIILTHAFVKLTKEVPKAEIRKAQRLRTDFLSRFDEQKLREKANENLSSPSE